MVSISPELAEICGIHAGDGYLRNRGTKIELDITGNIEEKEYYDNHVMSLINEFFGLNLKAKVYAKGTYGFVTTNKNFIIFKKLGFPYGKKSFIVSIPKKILESKDKVLYSRFLRGFFDTDGHLGFRKCYGSYTEFKIKYNHYPVIVLTTISKKLSEDLSFILNYLEIKHFVYGNQPKSGRDNYVYRVIINGTNRLEKWMNLIGSKNSVKFSRYLIWKKFGFCPTNLSLNQREDILNGKLNINDIGL